MRVQTRLSAVMGVIFGQKVDWGEQLLTLVAFLTILFFLAEVAALITGIRLSKTITGAVYELYEGTEHVKAGDFARVPVKGNDQLAELTTSFNSMTEDLSRLLVVAKKKRGWSPNWRSRARCRRSYFQRMYPPRKAWNCTASACRRGRCQATTTIFCGWTNFDGAGDRRRGGQGNFGGAADGDDSIDDADAPDERDGARPEIARRSWCRLLEPADLCHAPRPEKYATFCFGLYDECDRR